MENEKEPLGRCTICNKLVYNEKYHTVQHISTNIGSEVDVHRELDKYFCSDECQIINEINFDFPFYGEVSPLITHLINIHRLPIPKLERVLNSNKFKKYGIFSLSKKGNLHIK